MSPYETARALIAEARRQELPEAYRHDLVIDWRVIRTYKPAKFVWILRECGTEIVTAEDWRPQSLLDCAAAVGLLFYRNYGDAIYYTVDNGHLTRVTPRQAWQWYMREVRPHATPDKYHWLIDYWPD